MEQHTEMIPWLVVVAASAGGVDALAQVISCLPADLPAAMLIVQHLRGDRPTHIDWLLPLSEIGRKIVTLVRQA